MCRNEFEKTVDVSIASVEARFYDWSKGKIVRCDFMCRLAQSLPHVGEEAHEDARLWLGWSLRYFLSQ